MNEIHGRQFPNRKTKSFLYDSFLNFNDFGCAPSSYQEEIEFALSQEAKGEANCSWYEDLDGKNVVSGLALQNPYVRIVITKEGFQKAPSLTQRSKVALSNKLRKPDELYRLFTPHHAVSDPLRFIGRSAELEKILRTDYESGRLFLVSGERSMGKTSFAEMIRLVFSGNPDIATYCGLSEGLPKDVEFCPILVDASIGPSSVDTLLRSVHNSLATSYPSERTVTKKLSMGPAALRIEHSTTTTSSRIPVDDVLEFVRRLKDEGKRIVLIIDEFDSFENPSELSPKLRHLATHGLIACVVGTEPSFANLISGHISIARHALHIRLGPLGQQEFKEIFYLAELIAQDLLFFDEASLNRLFTESAGLPYFGQLFGFMAIRSLIAKDGSLENFARKRRAEGPAIVHEDMIDELISTLGTECEQLEHSFQWLSSRLSSGSEILRLLAARGPTTPSEISRLTGGTVTESQLQAWRNEDQLTARLVGYQRNLLNILDPVFRQYINIVKRPLRSARLTPDA